ncbi:MAG: fructose-1,6-bisphosphatase [Lachnospiraceae bacterium]|jgi:fructose-1,6-bisphosphatase-3|nr:fructose-1,6-bisphosphatase [Lachnospiraceae bacterium]
MKDITRKYLESLSELYPTIAKASTEIINLEAILNLPKGTEHFMSDIHGEYEAFSHVLKSGSGAVRRKIEDAFGNKMSTGDKAELATLIYYPREIIGRLTLNGDELDDWFRVKLYHLIEVCQLTASKYTRSKVRKALPNDFSYIIEELITVRSDDSNQESYYNSIIDSIIEIKRAGAFIVAICEVIQRLTVDHLHIVGDIYDRGPGPHIIIDKLMKHHSVDIQWGNHDVLWMGAASGELGCIANVVRICARYGNLDILEDGYGINLLPFATFAVSTYGNDPCDCFKLKKDKFYDNKERSLEMQMHKAMSIIQFKIEGQIINKYPEFHMEDRNLLEKIDIKNGTVEVDGKEYKLLDTNFPTVDWNDPYKLNDEEEYVMKRLVMAFTSCEKLQEHIHFLLNKGSLYKVYNNNLLYHGCVPLKKDGHFKTVNFFGKRYKGRALYDVIENYIRKGFYSLDPVENERGKICMWYTWLNENSPLFGKDKMATFERYFIAEKETHKERKNPYYQLLEDSEVVDRIIKEFGLDPENAHIINGHVPVKAKKGENPIKCEGKVIVIDGGFSRAYQKETGIAGYTLTYNSYGLILAAHEPFESTESAIEKGTDIHSDRVVVKRVTKRKLVGDTDIGCELKKRIEDLKTLLNCYRNGEIKER